MNDFESPPKVSSAPSAKKIVLTSFIVDALDVGSSLVITLMSGSVVMLAQVLQGVADLASSGILLLGVRASNKLPDKKYPFGHGREMYFWAMISAQITLFVTATFSFYFGFERFLHPEEVHNLLLAYIVLVVTALTNAYSFSLSYRRLGQTGGSGTILHKFFSSALIETKTAFVLDLMGTIASIIGLLSLFLYGITGEQRFDGLGAMVIGLSLAILAFLLIKSVKDLLVGHSAAPEVEKNIRTAALEIPEVKEVLDLRTMHLGPEKLLVNLEVHLQDDLDTDEIEKLTDRIKQFLQTKEPTVHHIQVELETPE